MITSKRKGTSIHSRLGVYFTSRLHFSKPNYVVNDEGEAGWWIIDRDDVLHKIKDPEVIAKTSKRTEYKFTDFKYV